MKNSNGFLIVCIAASSLAAPSLIQAARAALRAPEPTLAGKANAGGLEIEATAPSGNHFNLGAPKSMKVEGKNEKLQPASSSEKLLRFQLPIEGSGRFDFEAFLCDDGKSFCERHVLHGEWKAGALSVSKPNRQGAALVDHSPTVPPLPAKSHGFIVNDPAKAFAAAKSSGKSILIDFYGIWCPPCNQMDEEVFGTPEFEKASKNWVKLKLDADHPISWELKERYKVSGYPTLILVQSDGAELVRVVGSRPKGDFIEALSKPAHPGLTALALGNFEKAMQLLKDLPEHGEAYFDAQVGQLTAIYGGEDQAAAKAAKPKLVAVLQAAIAKYPATPDSITRRQALADLLEAGGSDGRKDEFKALREEGEKVGLELIAHPERLKGYDTTLPDLWGTIAELRASLGRAGPSGAAWKNAAEGFKKRVVDRTERGAQLDLAYALWNAGDQAAADEIYLHLQALYPNEFTFYHSRAKMLLREKRYAEALSEEEKALARSYWDNKLKVCDLIARIYAAKGDPKNGLVFLKKLWANAELPKDQKVKERYSRKFKEWEKLLGEK